MNLTPVTPSERRPASAAAALDSSESQSKSSASGDAPIGPGAFERHRADSREKAHVVDRSLGANGVSISGFSMRPTTAPPLVVCPTRASVLASPYPSAQTSNCASSCSCTSSWNANLFNLFHSVSARRQIHGRFAVGRDRAVRMVHGRVADAVVLNRALCSLPSIEQK